MQLTHDQLEKEGFHLEYQLKHDAIVEFSKEFMAKKNRFTLFYKLFLGALLFLFSVLLGFNLASVSITIKDVFSILGFSLALSFLLMPIHEGLHGVAYKWVGAPRVSFDANWKKLYFMALADGFVVNAREFKLVALLPFSVISISLLVIVPFVPLFGQLLCLGTVLVHGSMCGGDFALLSYLAETEEKEVVTYDDVANKISYFYSKSRDSVVY